jgi:hypothetical protein
MILVKEKTIVVLVAIILYDFFRNVLDKNKFPENIRRALFLVLPVVILGLWYLYHWHMTVWLINTNYLFFSLLWWLLL